MESTIILQKFYETTVYPLSKTLILQQEEKNRNECSSLKESILYHFILTCKEIKKMQDSNKIDKLSNIYYIYLNINILNKTFEYPILSFENDNIFSNEFIEMTPLKVIKFYDKLVEFWSIIGNESKKYLGNISPSHIENIVMEEAQKYHLLLKNFILNMITEMILLEEFRKIKLQSSFHIFIGGLYDYPFSLITINKNDNTKIKK